MSGQEEDDEVKLAAKQPIGDRVVHKNWRVREAAHVHLASKFEQAEEDDSVYPECAGLLVKAIKDANAAVQLAALVAVQKFAENASLDLVRSIANPAGKAVAEKSFSGRPINKKQAADTVLAFVYAEAGEPVIEGVAAGGFSHKIAKVAAACVNVTREAAMTFGASTVPVASVVKSLPTLLEHSNAEVRSSSKAMVVELCRWVGPGVLAALKDVKDVTMKDIQVGVDELAKQGAPKALRRTRAHEERAHRPGEAESGSFGAAVDDLEEGGQPAIDLRVEVELTAQLATIRVELEDEGKKVDWQGAVEHTKWSVRKGGLQSLQAAVKDRKLKSTDGMDVVVPRLRKVLVKDANVQVAAAAAGAIEALAGGLREGFPSPASRPLVSALLGRLKEKNRVVLEAMASALDALFVEQCVTVPELLDEMAEALSAKVPKVRVETLRWIQRCMSSRASAFRDTVKEVCPLLVKRCDDPQSDVRDLALECLAEMMYMFGEKKVLPFVSGLDKIRNEKIAEFLVERRKRASKDAESGAATDSSGTAAAAEAPATGRAVVHSPIKVEKQGADGATAQQATKQNEKPAEDAVLAPRRTEPATPTHTGVEAGNRVADGGSGEGQVPEVNGSPAAVLDFIDDAAVEDRARVLFPDLELPELAAKSTATRGEAVAVLKTYCEAQTELRNEDICSLLTVLCSPPGLQDTNFKVLNEKIEVVRCAVGLTSSSSVAGPLISRVVADIAAKLGDFKSGKLAHSSLLSLAERVPSSLVFGCCVETASTATNPRTLGGLLEMAADLVRNQRGLPTEEEAHSLTGIGLENPAPAIKGAAAKFAAVYDHMSRSQVLLTKFQSQDKFADSYNKAVAKLDPLPSTPPKDLHASCEPDRTSPSHSTRESAASGPFAEGASHQPPSTPQQAKAVEPSTPGRNARTRQPTAIQQLRDDLPGESSERYQDSGRQSVGNASAPRATPETPRTASSRFKPVTPASASRSRGYRPRLSSGQTPKASTSSPAQWQSGDQPEDGAEEKSATLPELIGALRESTSSEDKIRFLQAISETLESSGASHAGLQQALPAASARLGEPNRDVSAAAFKLFALCSAKGADLEEFVSPVLQQLTKKPVRPLAEACISSIVDNAGYHFLLRCLKRALQEEKTVVKQEILAWLLASSKQAEPEDLEHSRQLLLPVLNDLAKDKSAALRLGSSKVLAVLKPDAPQKQGLARPKDLSSGLRRPAVKPPSKLARPVRKEVPANQAAGEHARRPLNAAGMGLRQPKPQSRSRPVSLQAGKPVGSAPPLERLEARSRVPASKLSREVSDDRAGANRPLRTSEGTAVSDHFSFGGGPDEGNKAARPRSIPATAAPDFADLSSHRPVAVVSEGVESAADGAAEDWNAASLITALESEDVAARSSAAELIISRAPSVVAACGTDFGLPLAKALLRATFRESDVDASLCGALLSLLDRRELCEFLLRGQSLEIFINELINLLLMSRNNAEGSAAATLLLGKALDNTQPDILVSALLRSVRNFGSRSDEAASLVAECALRRALARSDEFELGLALSEVSALVAGISDDHLGTSARAAAAVIDALSQKHGRLNMLSAAGGVGREFHNVLEAYLYRPASTAREYDTHRPELERPLTHVASGAEPRVEGDASDGAHHNTPPAMKRLDALHAALDNGGSASPLLAELMSAEKENGEANLLKLRRPKVGLEVLRKRYQNLASAPHSTTEGNL